MSDHLSELCKNCFADCQHGADIAIKRTKCSAVICNVLAPHFKENLISDIGKQFFSLIIDESNDISVTKLLGLMIRYYSTQKKEIVTTFLEMCNLEDCNAEAICEAIKNCVKKHNLGLQKLLAIGTDNASVMTGINNGVYVKLKHEIPHLILIKCVCHSLQLAVSYAVKETLPRNLDFLIKNTYNWFSHSAMRHLKYKEIYCLLNEGIPPLKLVQVSQTRWLSIEVAISRMLNQWLELKTHFEMVRSSERCYDAELLYSMFNDKTNYVFLLFLKPILQEVQRVNKNFEAENHDPSKLLSDLHHLLQSLCSKVLMPGKKFDEEIVVENHLDPKPYLGYEFETEMGKCNFSQEDNQNIRGRCIKFILELIKQLRQRLPDNITILKKISELSFNHCLNPVKNDIIDLAKFFTSDSNELTHIDFQWKKLHTVDWKSRATIELWSEIFNYRDSADENPFENVSKFALKCLSLPHSNADVERAFSQMNIIKSKLRNKMHVKTLNAILAIKYGLLRHGKCCYNYELPKSVYSKIGTNASYEEELNVNSENDPSLSAGSSASQEDIPDWIFEF